MRIPHLSVVLLCGLAATTVELGRPAHGGPAWWHDAWKYRRKVTVSGQTNAPGPDIGYAEFYTAGAAAKDGRDIRVLAGKKTVPHQVLFMGPGDLAKLVIKVDKTSSRRHEYYVYYGNPTAKAMPHRFEIQRGLLMEARDRVQGSANNWPQMQRTLKASEGHVMDKGFVKTIFHGYNPFGPSLNCVCIYRGHFHCKQTGSYIFSITSDDAAFMLIDGKVTAQWPGAHRAVPYAHRARTRKLNLKAGYHKLEYYHLQLGDRYAAVAAWVPPWQRNKRKFEVIPESVFAPVLMGRVGPYERADKQACPDFSAAKRGETFVDGDPVVRVGFMDVTKPRPVTAKQTTWDWGDGDGATGATAEHVYLSPGLYRVTMTIQHRGKPYRVSQTIDAFQDWNKQTEKKTDALTSYYPRMLRYNFARMKPASLLMAVRIFEKLDKWRDYAKVAAIIVRRASEFDEKDLYPLGQQLAVTMSKRLGKHRDAILVLAKCESIVKAVPFKARLTLAAGDISIKYWHNPEQARRHYQRAISHYGKSDSNVQRRGLVGLGDSYRQEGDFEKAIEKYDQATLIPISGQPYQKKAVRVGTLARAIEYYINGRRERDHEEAATMLDTWEWEYPGQKLIGHSSVLRARLAHKLKQYPTAIAELEEFIGANPKSNYAGEALILLAECYIAKKDVPKAVDVLETLVSDYRDSDQVETAQAMLKKYKKPKKK